MSLDIDQSQKKANPKYVKFWLRVHNMQITTVSRNNLNSETKHSH